MNSEQATAAIARNAALWPGPLRALARELRWSVDKLRAWMHGRKGSTTRLRAPRESDAIAVRDAVRRLLLRSLEELDSDAEVKAPARRGTPPGVNPHDVKRAGTNKRKRGAQKHESPEVSPEAPDSA